MHKGAILDVHIVRSLRIAIHSAGLEADGRRHSARRLPTGSDEHHDPAVTLRWVGLLDIVRTIWSSAAAEANDLRGLFWSRTAPWFGLFRRLSGAAHARIQPIARSIARPGGC